MTSRREFLQRSSLAAGALIAGPRAAAALSAFHQPHTAPLKILILGGTNFIGPYQVQYALDRGYEFYRFYVGDRATGFMSHWMRFGAELMFVLRVLA